MGMVSVHLYRPFSVKHLLEAIPATCKRIAVLDRTKEPGAAGEPLYLDVKDAFYNQPERPLIVGGRYGLGSCDTTPTMIISVFDNLKLPEPKDHFTLGIVDDVTFTSLPLEKEMALGGEGIFEAKFYGLGADGTVGANKNSVKIIGDNTDKYCQPTSRMTPRSQAALPARTCALATIPSAPPIKSKRPTSWRATCRLTCTCMT